MRLLIADGHALVREGLRRVVLDVLPGTDLVEAADAAALSAGLAADPGPDGALFDDGMLAAREIRRWRRARPDVLLVALDHGADPAAAARLLGAGVNAVASRSAPAAVLGATLRVALAGSVYVQDGRAPLPSPAPRRGDAATAFATTGEPSLTSRQRQVLALVARDWSNKTIAAELGIGVRTVKGHLSVILRALQTDNRAEAARRARHWLGSTP
jgi:DNA-binding NarL/FixJ family response regulator